MRRFVAIGVSIALFITGLMAPQPALANASGSNTDPHIAVWAFGDSFVSGEGLGAYEVGSDTGENQCHRSRHSWPRQLARKLARQGVGLDGFIACSGATSDNLADTSQYNETPQFAQITSTPDEAIEIIGMIGGDEVGFGELLQGCLYADCNQAIDEAETRVSALPDKLTPLFSNLRSRFPDAAIDLLAYPNLVADPGTVAAPCYWNPETPGLGEITPEIMARLRALIQHLYNVIGDLIDRSDVEARVVDTRQEFAGHELCGNAQPAFFPADDSNNPLRPNKLGTKLLAGLAVGVTEFEFQLPSSARRHVVRAG